MFLSLKKDIGNNKTKIDCDMAEKENITNLNNPHDKLFRETWSNLENVSGFFQYRSAHLLL